MAKQQIANILLRLLVVCASLISLTWCTPGADPLGKANIRATHVTPYNDNRKNQKFVWPNSYYDIPKYRYPYYNEHGIGRLVYGYGGPQLYKYSVFKPEEGYFK